MRRGGMVGDEKNSFIITLTVLLSILLDCTYLGSHILKEGGGRQ